MGVGGGCGDLGYSASWGGGGGGGCGDLGYSASGGGGGGGGAGGGSRVFCLRGWGLWGSRVFCL